VNPDACDNDADLWLNLKSRLREGRDAANPRPNQWHYKPPYGVYGNELQNHWIASGNRHREAVLKTIETWIQSGSIPEQDEQVRFFFAARLDAAHDLVSALTFVKNSEWTTIFPFPKRTTNEILQLLLTDWWDGWGQFQFFERAYSESECF
jgi:hypothetical protein